MKINEIKQEKDKVVCSVKLDESEWNEIVKKEKIKASKDLKIPGFRKGKVPESEVLKHVKFENVVTNAANKAINETILKLESEPKLKKIDVEIYPTPSVEIGNNIDENNFSFDVIYWIIPKITIDKYKELDVKLENKKVSDKEIDEEIKSILAREKMLTKKENGTIAKGDQATFDFNGSIDGKEFPGGKAEKYELEIGSGQFIPGFEDQMVGMKIGDEKDIKVTFPKTYHAKELAGKDAVFKIKVHDVQSISRPELNEELIKGLNLPDKNVKTPAQFRKFLKENMEQYFKQQAYEKNIPLINKAIFDKAKYDNIPQVMIDDERKEISNQFKIKLEQMGVKYNDFLKMTGKNDADIEKELDVQAKQNCVVYGALDYIIEKEKIKLDDKTIQERYEALAKGYNKNVDEIKKLLSEDVLKESLLHENALLKLIEWNTK